VFGKNFFQELYDANGVTEYTTQSTLIAQHTTYRFCSEEEAKMG
jgi:hypothetical protein